MLKHVFIFAVFFILTSANDTAFEKFLDGNKKFAADTYKLTLRENKNRNFLVCPFSAETILSFAQIGARGRTKYEIRNALHLTNSTEELNSVFKNLLRNFDRTNDYTLNTANRIFIKDSYKITEHFAKTGKNVFNTSTENIDFSHPQDAARTINNWVSLQTKNKIQNLINPDALSGETVALLVNALYLQASWRKNFKKTQTRKSEFFNYEQTPVEVDTMRKSDYFGYYESDELDAKFLQIQFKGGRDNGLVVVLPNQKDGLKKLESQIEEVYYPDFQWEFVDVALPKFRLETSVDFKKILKKLGVKRAFSRADFSKMSGQKGEISISDIVQKNYIEVNENGVEAGAATAILYHPKSLMEFPGDKKTFIADHPFLFYIVIEKIVVFTGRFISPEI